jgi:TfoX/Sxy family transcriptional regulator of competence genes
MAYDAGLAEVMRQDLQAMEGIEERRMFGGLCFLWRGNMLCGVHRDGAMYRVGKDSELAALALEDVSPMAFTGRPMGGMVDAGPEAMADDARRARLLELARGFVGQLPAK